MVDTRGEDWERFGRARKPAVPELVELNAWRSSPRSFEVASYGCQTLIHRAHVVMLAEAGILSGGEAAAIIEGVKRVAEEAEDDPRLTGYMSTETALIQRIGDLGGKMHIARSRNDLGHTQRRLYYRGQVERMIGSLIEFRRRLSDAAENNLETYMPGYTHLKQAQPVTLAHYLLAHVEASGRAVGRLEDVYRRTNLSPLGSAAFAGTSWPIDRYRTMELLGFDGLVENSQDAVASLDYVMELSAALAIHMTNLSRLAQDVQLWSTDEYGMIDLDEAYSGTSSIMPQKKNPLVLEQVKSYASECVGAMVAVVSAVKGVSYSHMQDKVLLEPVVLDTVVGCTNVMAGVTETMRPVKEKMMERLRYGYSTMTDLADSLVRIHGVSFRQAHDIVVELTLSALRDDVKAEDITVEMVMEASEKMGGTKLKVPERELRMAVDPVLNVQRRSVIGGPAPESVREMIENQRRRLRDEKERRRNRIERVAQANEKLVRAEKTLGAPRASPLSGGRRRGSSQRA